MATPDRRAAIAVGVLLTLGLVALHLEYHRHAGALWRDEVNSVNVASLASVPEIFANLHYDSFPPAWIAAVCTWKVAGLAADDAGYRRLGLAIGLTMIGLLWWTGLKLGVGPPLVALLLFGMSPAVVIYGDMVRGYGLAALALIWAVGAVWAFVQRPSRATYAIAQIAAIAATQTHFGNAIPILGLGVGAAAVCWRRRDPRLLVASLALGAVAALLLFAVNYPILGYMLNAGHQEVHESIGLDRLVSQFAAALWLDVAALQIAWVLAAVLAIAGCTLAIAAPRDSRDSERSLYGAITAAITLIGTFYAYRRTGIPTHGWHYLSVIALSALGCEIGIEALANRAPRGAWIRIATIAALAIAAAPAAAGSVALRMTTVDLVAHEIESGAGPDDLVVVFPWVVGISFDRYYSGPAPWMTLPDLPDHRFHLHALIRERMELAEAGVAKELARVEQTLRRGDRVWIVGTPAAPDAGSPLPPIGSPTDYAAAGRHLDHWELQLGQLLEQRTSAKGTA